MHDAERRRPSIVPGCDTDLAAHGHEVGGDSTSENFPADTRGRTAQGQGDVMFRSTILPAACSSSR